jgi:NTE family protein
VLLPWLEKEHGQRPDIIVGTSAGALNAAYLGAHASEDAETVAEDGSERWREIRYRDVMEPILSISELAIAGRLALGLAFRGVAPLSLLDPAPLAGTLSRLIGFENIHGNVGGALRACAVVATAAHTNRSVVFHDGGPQVASDERRGIDYVQVQLTGEHVRASAAIPVVFPAVEVDEPEGANGWYFDGGTRLNTPLKPALKLGAERVIVIGLNSVSPAPSSSRRPDLFDGASQIIQGLLVDPLVNDVATLATINETLLHGGTASAGEDQRKVVPYILVAPTTPNRIGEAAREVYREYYMGLRGTWRSRDLALLGRLIGAGRSSTRGELFSYLFFAPEFATRLIELGRDDAIRWTNQSHDDGAWQRSALRARATRTGSQRSNREKVEMTRLEGKTALVTGASRGIGQDTARRLAADGSMSRRRCSSSSMGEPPA